MSTQPLLFDSLPETERARKPARRSRATTVAEPMAVDVVREAVPASPATGRSAVPATTIPMALVPPTAPVPPSFDPAALTNAELRALVQALPDQKLAHLLAESARELKRRVAPDGWEEDADSGPFEPNPILLRAARQTVGELSGDDS
ncbi:hypothetical protein [Azospirillum rugosum]|uniref:Uncharacterized protein n=1 Tax=Azospirillum rugosum TaxID=416170 RepID=A0ABS4SIL8_9PROT|nr:hypothetical protein [Azospirillum rugosum]MBP2292411.1 hypothetical protein [Azospirillum rugosum]MDQ0526170.1 hypothetical protein [Azospirillum rugosum]